MKLTCEIRRLADAVGDLVALLRQEAPSAPLPGPSVDQTDPADRSDYRPDEEDLGAALAAGHSPNDGGKWHALTCSLHPARRRCGQHPLLGVVAACGAAARRGVSLAEVRSLRDVPAADRCASSGCRHLYDSVADAQQTVGEQR